MVSWADVVPNQTPVAGPQPWQNPALFEGPQPWQNPSQSSASAMTGIYLPGCGPSSELILPNSDGFKSVREMRAKLRAILHRPGVATYLRDRKKQLGLDPEQTDRESEDKATENSDVETGAEDHEDSSISCSSSDDRAQRHSMPLSPAPAHAPTGTFAAAPARNDSTEARPINSSATDGRDDKKAGGNSNGGSAQATDEGAGGARPREVDRRLWAACVAGDVKAVRRALRAGASVHARDALAGNCTALHRAAVAGAEPVLHALRRAGASALARDADGDTPLHVAAAHGHTGPSAPPCAPSLGARPLICLPFARVSLSSRSLRLNLSQLPALSLSLPVHVPFAHSLSQSTRPPSLNSLGLQESHCEGHHWHTGKATGTQWAQWAQWEGHWHTVGTVGTVGRPLVHSAEVARGEAMADSNNAAGRRRAGSAGMAELLIQMGASVVAANGVRARCAPA
jgi:hypothetical protein